MARLHMDNDELDLFDESRSDGDSNELRAKVYQSVIEAHHAAACCRMKLFINIIVVVYVFCSMVIYLEYLEEAPQAYTRLFASLYQLWTKSRRMVRRISLSTLSNADWWRNSGVENFANQNSSVSRLNVVESMTR